MDRTLAGRPGIGRLTRSPAARRRAVRPASERRANPLDWALERLWRSVGAASGLVRGCCSFIWRRRRLRIATLVLLIALPLLAGGWLWLRGSSLVSVRTVRISGAQGPDARAIDAALTSAARGMSTLDVHAGRLRAAAASYPVVRDLRVTPSFPHGLRIHVIEQPPVAALTVSGARTAVAADGVVLGPALLSGSMPALAGSGEPATGQRLHEPALLGALALLGAAPAPLANLVTRAYNGPKGLTLAMRSGLLAYFGDATRPHAKWISLARVLADPSSAGASYVDVRLPERPAAGFKAGVAPPATSSSESGASSARAGGVESGEALAEGLTAAVGGSSSSASSASEPESSGTGSSGSSSTGSGESGKGAEASETTPAPGG